MQRIVFVFAATVVSLGTLVGDVRAESVSVSDDFKTTHDYLANGVSGTIWDGILNLSNATTLDANVTNSGNLTIALSNANVGYDSSHHNAPFLYKTVDLGQSFTAVLKTTDATAASYDVIGLMLYKNNSNFVSNNRGIWTYSNVQSRSLVAGAQSDGAAVNITGASYLELVWNASTSTATLFYGSDGASWTTLSTVVRTDLSGTADIGVYFGDYTSATSGSRVAQIDSFSLTTVPEPTALSLLAGAALSLMVWGRRRWSNTQ